MWKIVEEGAQRLSPQGKTMQPKNLSIDFLVVLVNI
jgi:hypothetical protein